MIFYLRLAELFVYILQVVTIGSWINFWLYTCFCIVQYIVVFTAMCCLLSLLIRRFWVPVDPSWKIMEIPGGGGLKQKCPPCMGVWIFSWTTHSPRVTVNNQENTCSILNVQQYLYCQKGYYRNKYKCLIYILIIYLRQSKQQVSSFS